MQTKLTVTPNSSVLKTRHFNCNTLKLLSLPNTLKLLSLHLRSSYTLNNHTNFISILLLSLMRYTVRARKLISLRETYLQRSLFSLTINMKTK